tara:strand:- start:4236 stop:4703 length:468 start_codon:yes stop_codon:yes gene_type:complete
MKELMLGQHQFGTSTLTSRTSLTSPTTDTFKAAMYFASATVNASTTAYSATGEVTNTSGTGYTAGGVTVTNATAPLSTNTSSTAGIAYWTPSASFTWSALTVNTAFDSLLVYNSTQSNKAVSVHTFGPQTITAGTFTLTMPVNDTTNALLRLATT